MHYSFIRGIKGFYLVGTDDDLSGRILVEVPVSRGLGLQRGE